MGTSLAIIYYDIFAHFPYSPDEIAFVRPVVTRLIEKLESHSLPHLSPNELAHLIVLIQTTLEVSQQ